MPFSNLVNSKPTKSALNFDMSKFRADFVGFEFTKLENGIKDYKEDKE